NLLLNAIDAMADGGEIRITTHFVGTPVSSRTPAFVELQVTDSGPGMSADQVSRIFQPFFTTKPSGSGLGLPVSKRIIDQHGGTVRVESELGTGTRFIIRLPVLPMNEKLVTLVGETKMAS